MIVAKSLWYHALGQALREPVSFGRIKTDARFPLAFCLLPGSGKLNIEYFVESIGKGMGDLVAKPVSYHEEALIGKVIRTVKNGAVVYEKVMGHFGADDVIFDDAMELVRSKTSHYLEARRYICKGLDTLGRNEVTKKAVNIPEQEALKYCPKCSMVIFFQPLPIPEESLLPGLFRRFPVIYLGFEEKDSSSEFKERLEAGCPDDSLSGFVKYLLEVRGRANQPLTFSSDFKECFNKYHSLLLSFGRMFGQKASNFARTLKYSFQNLLLKMAVTLARSEGRTEVGRWDIERAFVDAVEIYNSSFLFVEKKVQGHLDYGEDMGGAMGRDRLLLEWLVSREAISEEESDVSIREYQGKIQKVMEVKKDAARKIYQTHKNRGWILSKQRQQISRVWLAFQPHKDPTLGDMGDISKAYYDIVERGREKKNEEERKKKEEEEDKKIVSPITSMDV